MASFPSAKLYTFLPRILFHTNGCLLPNKTGQKTSQDHLRSTPINHTSHNSRSIFQQLQPGINTALPLNLVERATCPPEHMQSSDCRLGRPRTLAVLVVPSGDGGSCSAGTHLTPQHTSWVWVKNGDPFRPKRKFLKPLGYNHSLSFNPGGNRFLNLSLTAPRMGTSDPSDTWVVGSCLLSLTNCSPVSLQTSGLRHYGKLLQNRAALASAQGMSHVETPIWDAATGFTFAPRCGRTLQSARSPAVRHHAGTRTQGPGTPTCQPPLANVPPQQIPGSGGGVPQLLAQRPPERRVDCSAWTAHLRRVLIARGSLAAAWGTRTLGHARPGAPARRPARRPLRSTSPSPFSRGVLPLSFPPSPAPPYTLAQSDSPPQVFPSHPKVRGCVIALLFPGSLHRSPSPL